MLYGNQLTSSQWWTTSSASPRFLYKFVLSINPQAWLILYTYHYHGKIKSALSTRYLTAEKDCETKANSSIPGWLLVGCGHTSTRLWSRCNWSLPPQCCELHHSHYEGTADKKKHRRWAHGQRSAVAIRNQNKQMLATHSTLTEKKTGTVGKSLATLTNKLFPKLYHMPLFGLCTMEKVAFAILSEPNDWLQRQDRHNPAMLTASPMEDPGLLWRGAQDTEVNFKAL